MVRTSILTIRWDKKTYNDFVAAYNYIKRDSPGNAKKFRDDILSLVNGLQNNPLKYPPDKFKKDNSGSFRAFEKFSYRVAYKVSDEDIVILHFRHVKQEPFEY